MKYSVVDGQLEIKTTVYQGRNGCIYIDWGNQQIALERYPAEQVAIDIPDFNHDDFKKFYG